MRKFYGFFDNGTFKVGCNGGSIYVYDQNGDLSEDNVKQVKQELEIAKYNQKQMSLN